jgi:hypothetical protein
VLQRAPPACALSVVLDAVAAPGTVVARQILVVTLNARDH